MSKKFITKIKSGNFSFFVDTMTKNIHEIMEAAIEKGLQLGYKAQNIERPLQTEIYNAWSKSWAK